MEDIPVNSPLKSIDPGLHHLQDPWWTHGKWTEFIQHFSNQWPLEALYNIAWHSSIYTHIHTQTSESTIQGNSQLNGAVRVRCLAQGHLDTQVRGARDWTSNLLVSSRPALPPPPQQQHKRYFFFSASLQSECTTYACFPLYTSLEDFLTKPNSMAYSPLAPNKPLSASFICNILCVDFNLKSYSECFTK